MTRLFFVLLGISCILGAISMHGALPTFIDIPSLLIVFVPALSFTCAAHGLGGLTGALKAGMGDDPAASAQVNQHRVTLQTLRNTLCGSGAVGTLLGLVLMLRSMDDPTHIGPAMAVALLSGLYGIGCAELFVAPMRQRFLGGDSNESKPSDDGARGALTAIAVLMANTGLFFVLLFAMAPLA